jgi:hypothetical protein
MKNIHVLPTDKPSRLYLNSENKIFITDVEMKCGNTQNIYITSDEEITGFENNIWVHNNSRVWLWQNTMALRSNNKPKKIILTTDIDLIKDGVQAIDDEFLEWFVKNPSCEEVEVKEPLIVNVTDFGYKIIIPQEEPKQETPEEAAERLFPFTKDDFENRIIIIKRLFWIDGVKWQAKRSYAEEEVVDIMFELLNQKREECCITHTKDSVVRKVFEQFKKK